MPSVTDTVYFLSLTNFVFTPDGPTGDIGLRPFNLLTEKWQPTITGGPNTMFQSTSVQHNGGIAHQIQVLSNGHVVVVWTSYDAISRQGTLMVTEWDTTSWGSNHTVYIAPFVLTAGPTVVGVVVDKTDRLHIFIYDFGDFFLTTKILLHCSYKSGVVSGTTLLWTQSATDISARFSGAVTAYDVTNDRIIFGVFQSTPGELDVLTVDSASVSPTFNPFEVVFTGLPLATHEISYPAMLINGTDYVVAYNDWDKNTVGVYIITYWSRPISGGSWTQTIVSTQNVVLNLSVSISPMAVDFTSLGLTGIVPWWISGASTATQFNVRYIASGNNPIAFDPDVTKYNTGIEYFVAHNGANSQDGPWVLGSNIYQAARRLALSSSSSSDGTIEMFKTLDGVTFTALDSANASVFATEHLPQANRYKLVIPPPVVSGAIMLSMGESMTDVSFPHMS